MDPTNKSKEPPASIDTMDPKEALDMLLNSSNDPSHLRRFTGYMPIEHYGLIGNMRTCALIAKDAAIDFMCWPDFDSPSVFCRMLDKDRGGHFSVAQRGLAVSSSKQSYLPSSNLLQTRFLGEEGVLDVVDFFPLPAKDMTAPLQQQHKGALAREDPRKWVVRRVESVRGTVDVEVEVLPVS
jgi:GH15 family glucan-1,4-alpha-glucosidase